MQQHRICWPVHPWRACVFMAGERKFLRQSKGRAVWARLGEVGTCGCMAVTISWDSLVLIEGPALGSGQGRAWNAANLFLFSAIFLLHRDIWMLSTCLVCHCVAGTFDYIRLLRHKAEDCLEGCLSKLIDFCLFDLILPSFHPTIFQFIQTTLWASY